MKSTGIVLGIQAAILLLWALVSSAHSSHVSRRFPEDRRNASTHSGGGTWYGDDDDDIGGGFHSGK